MSKNIAHITEEELSRLVNLSKEVRSISDGPQGLDRFGHLCEKYGRDNVIAALFRHYETLYGTPNAAIEMIKRSGIYKK